MLPHLIVMMCPSQTRIRTFFALALLGSLFWQAPHAHGEEAFHAICHHQHMAPPTSAAHRKYAPSRWVDFLHLKLDITPSFENRTVAGETTLSFKPISQPVSVLELDAVDLEIATVQASTPLHDWHLTENQLVLHFAQAIPVGTESWVRIRHEAEPAKGMYFRTPEMGYLPGETHLFTQGEPIESRHWFPCFDSPNEKLTTEVICHVPDGMTVLSNGRKLREEKDDASDKVTFHWLQDKPHVNYLIAITAGYFESIQDQYRDIPMAFYTLPSRIDQAANSYRGTREMMAFIETETGVPYPWDRYDQICVNDFVAGGMENTTLTILTDGTLFGPSTENLRSSQNLVAHELAHQWFGDLVTCKDWSHLWLNEGFATYFEALYREHSEGTDAFRYAMLGKVGGWINNPNDPVGIVNREYDDPMQQFGYRAYPKAGWVLHMIRSQIGPDLFRQVMKTYLERHAFKTAVTQDLNAVLEELTGRSFDQFFDQWVYHGGHPDLEVTYSWDTERKLAKLNIQQKQKVSDNVLLFRFPLTVRFKSDAGTHSFDIEVKEVSEDFYFPLPSRPEIARIDPDLELLCRMRVKLPDPMLYAQLRDSSDVIGRILAVRQLGKKSQAKVIAALKERLQADAFYGVRIEAAKALGQIHTPEALTALLEAQEQEDARVRQQVVSAVGGFFDDEAQDLAVKLATSEANPLIRTTAITALSAYPQETVKPLVLTALASETFQERVAGAAIRVIRERPDTSYAMPLLEMLLSRQQTLPTRVMSAGLEALARAAHPLPDRSLVREFLLAKTKHPKNGVRSAALRALGALGDPEAIPALTRFTRQHQDHRDFRTAQSALDQLRAKQPPQQQLKHLRESINALESAETRLKRQIETLGKQLDALVPKDPPAAPEDPELPADDIAAPDDAAPAGN